jgi:hypothetical protein
VAYAEEEISVGTRGSDEVTLISAGKYARLQEELRRLRAEVVELRRKAAGVRDANDEMSGSEPFAALQRSLEAGRFSVSAEPRTRRLLVDAPVEGRLSREERIRLGSRGNPEPERRRSGPRA